MGKAYKIILAYEFMRIRVNR